MTIVCTVVCTMAAHAETSTSLVEIEPGTIEVKRRPTETTVFDDPKKALSREPEVEVQPAGLSLLGARPQHSAVVVDGFTRTDPTSPAQTFSWLSLESADTERPQTFVGPQTARFGRGALGGALSLESVGESAGRFDETDVQRLKLGGTSQSGFSGEGAILSRPWLTVPVQVGARGSFRHEAGRSASFEMGATNEVDASETGAVSAQVLGGERDLRIRARVGRQWSFESYDAWMGPGGDDPNAHSGSLIDSAELQVETPLLGSWPGLRLSGIAERAVRETRNDIDDQHPAFFEQSRFESLEPQLQLEARFALFDQHRQASTESLRLGLLDVLTHVDSQFSVFGYSEALRTRENRVEPFAAASLPLTQDWVLEPALRLSKTERSPAHLSSRLDSRWMLGDFADRSWTARIGGGIGAQTPSLYQRRSVFGDPALPPERAIGADVGLESESTRLVFFQTRFSSLIDFDGYPVSRYVARGAMLSRGVLAEQSLRLGANRVLGGQWRFVDSRLHPSREDLLRSSRHKGRFWLDQGFLRGRLTASASQEFRSAFWDRDAQTGQLVRAGSQPTTSLALTSSFRIRPTRQLLAGLQIENIFDRPVLDLWGTEPEGRMVRMFVSAEL